MVVTNSTLETACAKARAQVHAEVAGVLTATREENSALKQQQTAIRTVISAELAPTVERTLVVVVVVVGGGA